MVVEQHAGEEEQDQHGQAIEQPERGRRQGEALGEEAQVRGESGDRGARTRGAMGANQATMEAKALRGARSWKTVPCTAAQVATSSPARTRPFSMSGCSPAGPRS